MSWSVGMGEIPAICNHVILLYFKMLANNDNGDNVQHQVIILVTISFDTQSAVCKHFIPIDLSFNYLGIDCVQKFAKHANYTESSHNHKSPCIADATLSSLKWIEQCHINKCHFIFDNRIFCRKNTVNSRKWVFVWAVKFSGHGHTIQHGCEFTLNIEYFIALNHRYFFKSRRVKPTIAKNVLTVTPALVIPWGIKVVSARQGDLWSFDLVQMDYHICSFG